MFHKTLVKLFIIVVTLTCATCSIDGSFYPNVNSTRGREDPCNPLYWYPKNIPEYCFYTTTMRPKLIVSPIPMPLPIPVPPPPFYPPVLPPIAQPIPAPAMASPGMPPQAMPVPIMAPPIPLPFGVPIIPTNPMIPVAGIQYYPFHPPPPAPPTYPMPAPFPASPTYPIPASYRAAAPYPMPPQRQVGMVPGLPGIVSHDGGINILPFSDVYADILERHKQKIIRRRLQKFLDAYEQGK